MMFMTCKKQTMEGYAATEDFTSDADSLTKLRIYSLCAFPLDKTPLHFFLLFAMQPVTS